MRCESQLDVRNTWSRRSDGRWNVITGAIEHRAAAPLRGYSFYCVGPDTSYTTCCIVLRVSIAIDTVIGIVPDAFSTSVTKCVIIADQLVASTASGVDNAGQTLFIILLCAIVR